MGKIVTIAMVVFEIALVVFTIGSLQNYKVNVKEKLKGISTATYLFLVVNLILYIGNIVLGQEQKATISMLNAISSISLIYIIAYTYFLTKKK